MLFRSHDARKAAEATALAARQGVPVLAYDRLVLRGAVDAYVSFDNRATGELMARRLSRELGGGSVAIVNGASSDNNSELLRQGFYAVLDPLVAGGLFRILDESWADLWAEDKAYLASERLLSTGIIPDGFIAGNDGLAGAIVQSLSERRLAGRVFVVGQDADLAACQRIVEGTQLATVYKPIHTLAAVAADLAISLALGDTVKAEGTIFDGERYIPFVAVQPVLVDAATLDATVIADGFHSLKDIYRNLPTDR